MACQQPAGSLIPREREVLQGKGQSVAWAVSVGFFVQKGFRKSLVSWVGRRAVPGGPFKFRSDSSMPRNEPGSRDPAPRVSPAISISHLCGGGGWGLDVKVSRRQAGRQTGRSSTGTRTTSGFFAPFGFLSLRGSPCLVNYLDSAQAVAASQFNKHFLCTHSQQCSWWAMVLCQLGKEKKQPTGEAGLHSGHCSWCQGLTGLRRLQHSGTVTTAGKDWFCLFLSCVPFAGIFPRGTS